MHHCDPANPPSALIQNAKSCRQWRNRWKHLNIARQFYKQKCNLCNVQPVQHDKDECTRETVRNVYEHTPAPRGSNVILGWRQPLEMPQYDDTFLDSPIFRRRTRSYAVHKELVPKSSSFITATPLLLAVTNHARSLSGSLSTCSLKGNKEKRETIRVKGTWGYVPASFERVVLKRERRFLSFFVVEIRSSVFFAVSLTLEYD